MPVPETGTYSISLQIRIEDGVIDEELTSRILVNGSAIGESRVDGTDLETPYTQGTPTVDVELDSGDKITADVRQVNSNNADRQIRGVDLFYTFLRVRRV
ncbi:hypothetical protein [Halorubrum sp. Ea1]|uniref:hypothetical protein n=1 Tax=Halorubrum sp. Ea1 TaxID=1480718 RepID=UPI00113FD0DB|nr:hypothetical protein [Halorubrum sp. Ea1]